MDDVAALLLAHEEALLTAGVRGSRVALEALLLSEFREFGSSGRVFDRVAIVDALQMEVPGGEPPSIQNFMCAMLGGDSALVTYRTVRNGSVGSLRSSVWVLRSGRWQMLFHQGTRAAGSVDLLAGGA